MTEECPICDRVFDHWNPMVNENSLKQHLQVMKILSNLGPRHPSKMGILSTRP